MWPVELGRGEGQADPSPLGLEGSWLPPLALLPAPSGNIPEASVCSALPQQGCFADYRTCLASSPVTSPLAPCHVCRFSQVPSSGAPLSLVGRK